MLVGGWLFCSILKVQSCKVKLYGVHRPENCCSQRCEIFLPWVPDGKTGEVRGAGVTRRQPAVCSFHRKRLKRGGLLNLSRELENKISHSRDGEG